MVYYEALYVTQNQFKKIMLRKIPGRSIRVFNIHRYLLTKLVDQERIVTTQSFAVNLGQLTDVLILNAKNGNDSLVYRWLTDKSLTKKVMNELSERYSTQENGYTKIFRLPNADFGKKRAVIELIGNKWPAIEYEFETKIEKQIPRFTF
ncbi:50S ribosomal protein L17 [Thelohanellus kitauei]|uniref:Large ribosomal subunit protein bL17m n=1 Tax=Thelohanellus kitauei TaxID=669202 RepID=A0A0C2N294_THEKT|nr:50S ribosomal protein L17 [Thelohanellus kitauei]